MSHYDVIIVGGGPVGSALAIELGMQNIKTLVLEKYSVPLKGIRAQSLTARSMEFCMRWGIDEKIEDSVLLSLDFPFTGNWCSALNGKSYYCNFWGDNRLAIDVSPKRGIRIPLWITENILREKIDSLESIDFIKSNEVKGIQILDDDIVLKSYNKQKQCSEKFHAKFVACCDGAKGISKRIFDNTFNALSDKTKVLSITFRSYEIREKQTVAEGVFYCVVNKKISAFIGPVDLNEGLWGTQIIWKNTLPEPTDESVSKLLEQICGFQFNKEIVEFHFWYMQTQMVEFFSLNNRVFWLGDSAHASPPTGGLGVNTGLGDAVNLGWKLATVIREESNNDLLKTYELERRAVCENNLHFAKEMADRLIEIKKQFPPEKDIEAFSIANAKLAKDHLSSSGLSMGYHYSSSPLTHKNSQAAVKTFNPFVYEPVAEPGYFLPHVEYKKGKSIYQFLSLNQWNLIICDKDFSKQPNHSEIARALQLGVHQLHLLLVDLGLYSYRYLLIRPDWHIYSAANSLDSLTSVPFSTEDAIIPHVRICAGGIR